MGACTYDVYTGKGGGGTPKADVVRKLKKEDCVKMQTGKFCKRHV